MTGHEKGGSRSRIEERTAIIAAEEGRRAANEIQSILIGHLSAGRISEEQLDAIMAAEQANAEAKFKAEREAGLHNDTESQSAGLTATIKKVERNESSSR